MSKILFIVEEGFDDLEFFYFYHRVIEEGFEPVIASSRKYDDTPLYDPVEDKVVPRPRRVHGKHGYIVETNVSFREALDRLDEYIALVIPGGRGPDRMRRYPEAVEIVKKMVEKNKPVLAICHGPQMLISAGVLKNRRVTGYWGIRDDIVNAGATYMDVDAYRDGNIVTIRHTTVLGKGSKLFIELLKK